jgi:hypothetical protein
MRALLTFLLCAGLVGISTSAAADSNVMQTPPPPGYPGLMPDGRGVVLVAPDLVQQGLLAYFELHGDYPRRWKDVVDAGLCQVELRTSSGRLINPDDSSLDFYEDIYYHYRPTAECEILHVYNIGGRHVKTTKVERMQGVTLCSALEGGKPELTAALSDEQIFKAYLVRTMLSQSVMLFYDVRKRMPQSLAELLDSGLCLFDRQSINPASGQPFSAGTGPWGISITDQSSPEKPGRVPRIEMRDGQGRTLPRPGYLL